MKFFDRTQEIRLLKDIKESATENARFTVLTGRRRIGKTSLVMHAYEDDSERMVYLFVARKAEKDLCKGFANEISEKLGIPILGNPDNFADIFEMLMKYSEKENITVFIDEFQDFKYVNPSVYSEMQRIWDLHKSKSKINLIVAGSINSMMDRIFRDKKEPLFQRETSMIKLRPLMPSVVKEIMEFYHPHYTKDDLLALYSFTGGVAKYIEVLIDGKAFTPQDMIDLMVRDGSIFIEEGNVLLIAELGKEYGTYFSILSAIASGKTTRVEIENVVGKEIGGYLTRLENDYELIGKRLPIYSTVTTKNVCYEIRDNFLTFWFRFINRYGFMMEIHAFEKLKSVIKRDYETFTGWMLERYFRQKLQETDDFTRIGGWWDRKGMNEIDIVASDDIERKIEFIEVKRNEDKYRKGILEEKTKAFLKINRDLDGYQKELKCLSLQDM